MGKDKKDKDPVTEESTRVKLPPPRKLKEDEIRVVTFNVCIGTPLSSLFKNGTAPLSGSRRLAAQLAALAYLDADIICLQEVSE